MSGPWPGAIAVTMLVVGSGILLIVVGAWTRRHYRIWRLGHKLLVLSGDDISTCEAAMEKTRRMREAAKRAEELMRRGLETLARERPAVWVEVMTDPDEPPHVNGKTKLH